MKKQRLQLRRTDNENFFRFYQRFESFFIFSQKKERKEFEFQIDGENEAVKSLSIFAKSLVINIISTLNLSHGVIFIRQPLHRSYKPFFPFIESKSEINFLHPLVSYLLNYKNFFTRRDLAKKIQKIKGVYASRYLREIDCEFERQKAVLLKGIYSGSDLIGFLFLGPKERGELNSKDFELISNLLESYSKELGQILHFQDAQLAVLKKSTYFRLA